jgi:nucleotide-binding universal stress UspA family protein
VFTCIVIANDGSEGSFKALALGLDLAKRYGATLHMISVEELPDFPASIDEIVEIKEAENHKYHDVVARARAEAAAARVALDTEVLAGHAAASVVERVKALNADLLIVGFMGPPPFMSGSSAGPRIGWCDLRRVPCW